MSRWAAHHDLQRVRRKARVKRRLDILIESLPPGVEVKRLTGTSYRLSGYGYTVVYDATHNSALIVGVDISSRTMAPENIAAEFRWRWKREGCPP